MAEGSLGTLVIDLLCGLIPLLVGILRRDPQMGAAGMIGAASMGALGGLPVAIMMSLCFAALIHYAASVEPVYYPGPIASWLSERPTRMKLQPVLADRLSHPSSQDSTA
jgi:hypothetical protein